jgi:membrane glycosyltransferase
MAYLCSPIWLMFLLAGSIGAYDRARFLAFSAGPEDLGAAQHSETPYLFVLTMLLLFLPRVLGIISHLSQTRRLGDLGRSVISAVVETIASILIAPVLMLFHTFFVLQVLMGWQTSWTAQNRTDTGLPFFHCLKLYGWQSLLGLAGQTLAWFYFGLNSYWLTPIFAAWLLAPLTAWVTSWSSLGLSFRARGLLVIPEESHPPAELGGLILEDDQGRGQTGSTLWPQALLSPYVQAVHLSLVRQRFSATGDTPPAASISKLRERLVLQGPGALERKEILRLLWDAETVCWLHRELWSRPDKRLHSSWKSLQSGSGTSAVVRQYLIVE